MKLNVTPRIPSADPALIRELKDHAQQVNALSEGRMVGTYNALTAAPTAGQFNQGDFVRNLTPTELGSPGSKYVITGWLCVVGGTPGTFVPVRPPTGN